MTPSMEIMATTLLKGTMEMMILMVKMELILSMVELVVTPSKERTKPTQSMVVLATISLSVVQKMTPLTATLVMTS